MRELLVIFGLISLGYFAQSSIGMALSKSCEYYEEIATNARVKSHQSRVIVAVPQRTQSSFDDSLTAQEARREYEVSRKEVGLQPVSDVHEVKISQTGPKASPTIR